MKIEIKIHKVDFPELEMSLFGYEKYGKDTEITVGFHETEEKYLYKTELVGKSYLLVTGV